MTVELTPRERVIYDEVSEGLEHVPALIQHRLEVYARAFDMWRRLAPQLQAETDCARLYKLGGTSAVLLKQVDTASAAIERERVRQEERRRAEEAKRLMMRGHTAGQEDYDAA